MLDCARYRCRIVRSEICFVSVKYEAKQASAVVFRTRDSLIGRRAQIINAIGGHM
jgi:transposase